MPIVNPDQIWAEKDNRGQLVNYVLVTGIPNNGVWVNTRMCDSQGRVIAGSRDSSSHVKHFNGKGRFTFVKRLGEAA